MTKSRRFIQISLTLFLLSSCGMNKFIFNSTQKNSNESNIQKNIPDKEKFEIKVSCGKGDINKFLEDGWKITKEYSEEIVCSWKSKPANKRCNMDRDKGCRITIPDKIGVETYYLLEK